MKKKSLFIILLLLTLFSGLSIYLVYQFTRKPEKVVDRKIDFTRNATELLLEFENNETESNLKYIGKTLLLEGRVLQVEEEDDQTHTLYLNGSDESSVVRCRMDISQNEKLKKLSNGTQVKVKGLCNGFNADDLGIGIDILFTQCMLVSQE